MILDNIRLYLADPQTGLLEMRFICHHCGGEITDEPKCQLRRSRPGTDYKVVFWHDNDYCYEQDEEK